MPRQNQFTVHLQDTFVLSQSLISHGPTTQWTLSLDSLCQKALTPPCLMVQRCHLAWRKAHVALILTSRSFQNHWKLASRLIGPYPIAKMVNPVAVRLPRPLCIRPTFHISQLMPEVMSDLVGYMTKIQIYHNMGSVNGVPLFSLQI